MAARGDVVDLLDAYARQIPITVLCELLGVPVADRQWIWVTVTDYDRGGEEQERVPQKLGAYLTELIAAKRAEPGGDLLSALILARDSAEEQGGEDGITGTELLSMVYQLIMAGFDTTANLIAWHPGVADAPRGDGQAARGPVAAPGRRRGARFPGTTLAVPPEELRWRPVSLMNGLESLPVRLAADPPR